MERASAARARVDTSRLDRTEIIGMAAAVVLVISVFIEWYSVSPETAARGNDPANWACGVGNSSCSGWDTFPVVSVLLILAALAPFILSWIVMRGHALSWPRGEMTAVVGLIAFVLVAFNGIIDKPEDGINIGLTFGYWLALLASFVIFLSGGFRAVESGGGAQRKPPATF
jgi:hypothetical protein